MHVDKDTTITLRRHGSPEAQQCLVLTHGNGFASDCYYPFWSLLCKDFDLIIYDLRNHGWNTVGLLANHNVPVLVQDHDKILTEIDHHYGSKPIVGVFHSVSSLLPLLSSHKGDSYVANVLFDPPLVNKLTDQKLLEQSIIQRVKEMSRRTDKFQSLEDFVEILAFSPHFQHVLPGVLELFAQTTLRARSDGDGYELRCPREYEARLMEYAVAYTTPLHLDYLAWPTKVIGG